MFDAAKDQYLLNWLQENTTPYTWSVLASDPAKVIRYAHQTCLLLQIEPIMHVDHEIEEATGWDSVTTSMVTSSATTVYPNCPLRQS